MLPTLLFGKAEWRPSAALGAGYIGTMYSSGPAIPGTVWHSTYLRAELSLPALSINDRHTLSLPFTLSQSFTSATSDRMAVSAYSEWEASLRYGFIATDWLELSISSDAALLWYPKQHASEWRFGGSAAAAFYPLPSLAIELPITLLTGRGALSISAGIMIRVLPGGLS